MPDNNATPWSDRSESLGYQINLLARLLAALLQREIAAHGVVPGQFAVLLALYDRDRQSLTELCRAVRIEPGTMTKTVQRMERDGLVLRHPDPEDRRSFTIELSERSRALEPTLKDGATRVNRKVTSTLSARQVREFMRTLDMVIGEAAGLVDAFSARR
jgi:DNA-binding MarR family transcriptional regulator